MAPVLVIGAGIGGLAAAIGLARKGHSVTVTEQAEQLQNYGAGLQLSPNALHALDYIGAKHAVLQRATETKTLQIFDENETLQTLDMQRIGIEYGASFLTLHRADLQAALLEVASTLPAIDIKLGYKLLTIAQNEHGVVVAHYDNGVSIQATAAIGADGVHSATRAALFNQNAQPTGLVAWRGMAPMEVPPSSSVDMYLCPRAHVVTYPLAYTGKRNVVWVETAPKIPTQKPISFFKNKALHDLVEQIEDWGYWPLFIVAPMASWTKNTVTLLGDAAHAMPPFAAQGACMALEDAAVLAIACEKAKTTAEFAAAFKLYETRRKPRAQAVQNTSIMNGIFYHFSGFFARIRNSYMRRTQHTAIIKRMGWIWGWRV